MNTLSIKKTNISDEEVIFEKKKSSITLETLYIKKHNNSPFQKKKEYSVSIKHGNFRKLGSYIEKMFLKLDKAHIEKEEINKVVENLIEYKSFNDLNDFFKNGLILNSSLTDLFLNKLTDHEIEHNLFDFQKNNPLYGSLGYSLFISSHFQIYCHETMQRLVTKFPQEMVPLSILDNFGGLTTYKNIRVRDLSYSKDNAAAAINMHNTCLDPKFSIPLFFHILDRILGKDSHYTYTNIDYNVIKPLTIIFPYIKSILKDDDKLFLKELLKKSSDKLFKDGASEERKNLINDLYTQVVSEIAPDDNSTSKAKMLERIRVLYNNDSQQFNHFLPLKIEDGKYLASHQILLDKIKVVHFKLSNSEEFFDNDTITNINKITADTLPLTLLKYQQIDVHFRDNIKNIEGKNAHQLLDESLNNILLSLQQIELHLEQEKVNSLSVVNRKNKVKTI